MEGMEELDQPRLPRSLTHGGLDMGYMGWEPPYGILTEKNIELDREFSVVMMTGGFDLPRSNRSSHLQEC